MIIRSICHGRYQRSITINLRENTVDIDGRSRSTYVRIRSISTVDHDQPTGENGRYRRSITIIGQKIGRYRRSITIHSEKNRSTSTVDHEKIGRFFRQIFDKEDRFLRPDFDKEDRFWRPIFAHPLSVDQILHIHWPTRHGQYRRSITINLRENTVDINGRSRSIYGGIRSILTVDHDPPTENYGRSSVWSI